MTKTPMPSERMEMHIQALRAQRPTNPEGLARRCDELERRCAQLLVENEALLGTAQQSRASEWQLHLLHQNITDYAIFLMDVHGKITSWNIGAERILGFAELEAIGQTGAIIFTPEDRAAGAVEQEFGHALESGCATDERWHLRKDGSRFWANGVLTALRDEADRHVGFAKILRDFTAQKLAADERERLLNEFEAEHRRLEAVLTQMPAGVIIADIAGRMIMRNAQAEIILGEALEESSFAAHAALVQRLFHPDGRQYRAHEMPLARALNGEVIRNEEIEYRQADGRRCLLTMAAAPIRDRHGSIAAATATFYDITERRRLQNETLKASKLESIGLLAGGIAHDFNNLLTAIVGNLFLTKLALTNDHEAQASLNDAEAACMRAAGLTQQLLTFSKGGAPITKRISAVELLRETVSFVARGAGVRCELTVADNLWPLDVDEGQMTQVINNLVINAQQAMPDGGRLRVCAENLRLAQPFGPLVPGAYVKIVFDDEGIGIPAEQLPKVFDPFFTTKPKGSGLGLTSAYWIVQKHKGHITVERRATKGTRVSIYLPAHAPSETAAAPSAGAEEAASARRKRILVLDDDATICAFLSRVLRHFGYDVETVDDGAAAVACYRAAREQGRPFDLAILDLTIPGGMGGLETMNRLREFDPDVRAMVSSGYSNDPVMADYLAHGFSATVAKPYRIDTLREKLTQVLATGRPAAGG